MCQGQVRLFRSIVDGIMLLLRTIFLMSLYKAGRIYILKIKLTSVLEKKGAILTQDGGQSEAVHVHEQVFLKTSEF